MKTIVSIAERMKVAGIEPHPARPPVYKCGHCRDLHWVRQDLQPGHPDFGKLMPCPACGGGSVQVIPDDNGLLPAERGLTWADLFENSPEIRTAKDHVKEVLERGYGWVYVFGAYGTAKTTMLKIAIAESQRGGLGAAYTRMPDFLDNIRLAFDKENPQEDAARRLWRWSHMNVLALDEVEKINETDFVKERRFQLLDDRYQLATREQAGVTLLAGNVKPELLDPAIASRVRDGRFEVIHLTAKDARPLMRPKDDEKVYKLR